MAHAEPAPPSDWVRRFAGMIAPAGRVLDVACGRGRHVRLLRRLGHRVAAIDIDVSGIADLADDPDVEIIEADLEGASWPCAGRRFDAVVVTNYLHRPLFPTLLASLDPRGLLIYETFAAGHERLGRPRNPDYLLERGELLALAMPELRVIAYEDLAVETPRPAMVQRICARRERAA